MSKYSIGLDFGTLSCRALLVDLVSGAEIATSTRNYPHAVIDRELPSGAKLPNLMALQIPNDYVLALTESVKEVVKISGIDVNEIVGIGLDFTACSILPLGRDGKPLCEKKEFENNPHAYVKLWKSHSAQKYSDKITQLASERGEDFLKTYGGKISSEWLLSKAMETLYESPNVFASTYKFVEAGDYIAYLLTGNEVRNACAAGYKGMWSKTSGFPSKEFLKELDSRLENFVEEKLSTVIKPAGTLAGNLSKEGAKLLGLPEGIAVSNALIDAHAAVPACGCTKSGEMMLVIGTSSCHMLLGDKFVPVEGICGAVEDGILGGFVGFEAGQVCCGDHFDWVVKHITPKEYYEKANEKGVSIHQYLTSLVEDKAVGYSGLLALDWWNGNRSILVDGELSGVILGMTLQTRVEDIYRALIEATAFGTKIILDNFADNGVPVDRIVASGGIADKNQMLMQIYADVTNREFKIAGSSQSGALGSAMFGAVAAGSARGGFDNIDEAGEVLAKVKDITYVPNPDNVKKYQVLFEEYKKLHDYFGRGENNVLKTLLSIKNEH